MTGWERFSKLLKELWLIFKPTDTQGVWQLVILIAIILVAFFIRKEGGGFWKTLWRIIGTIVLLMILNAISPYLMWGMLVLTVIWFICECVHIPIKSIIVTLVAIAVFVMAFYNAFVA